MEKSSHCLVITPSVSFKSLEVPWEHPVQIDGVFVWNSCPVSSICSTGCVRCIGPFPDAHCVTYCCWLHLRSKLPGLLSSGFQASALSCVVAHEPASPFHRAWSNDMHWRVGLLKLKIELVGNCWEGACCYSLKWIFFEDTMHFLNGGRSVVCRALWRAFCKACVFETVSRSPIQNKMWSPTKLLKRQDFDISKWEKVVAVAPKTLDVINLLWHFFRIVVIFSLTHGDLRYDDTRNLPVWNLGLTSCFLHCTLLTHALANCDVGAGEPLEKTCVEPFKNANRAFKMRQKKPSSFSVVFTFLSRKRNHR